MSRGLNDEFIQDLITGVLKPLYDRIRVDDTLDLQIRDNYINIYYRGGCLLKLKKDLENSGVYLPTIDRNYFAVADIYLHDCIDDSVTVHGWASAIPELKSRMDIYFHHHPKNEREFAQNFVRENNRIKIIAPGPDYFICDVEYNFTVPGAKGQFDAVAVRWDSTATARKNNKNLRLALVEFKFGDGALGGKAGIEKHISDARRFLTNKDIVAFKEEMRTVFNQKRRLGYILSKKDIDSFSDQKPEYIFVLANHDPAKTGLRSILKNIEEPQEFDLKFARANFFGSGLYRENVKGLKDFERLV